MIEKIKRIVDENSHRESKTGNNFNDGNIDQRLRLELICKLSLENYEGDILEIGSHIGITTKILAKLARENNRKVVVIDPWDGRQQGNQSVYEKFLENTKEFSDIIEVNRLDSMSEESKNIIKSRSFAFCWIDGLHTPEACGSDIDSCSTQNGILAVDDLRWAPGLKDLFFKKSTQHQFENYYNELCREGYYVTNNK